MDEVVSYLMPYKDFTILLGVFIGACIVIYRRVVLPIHKVIRVMATIIDRELTPNSGSSMKDNMSKINSNIAEVKEEHRKLDQKVTRIDGEMQGIRNDTKRLVRDIKAPEEAII